MYKFSTFIFLFLLSFSIQSEARNDITSFFLKNGMKVVVIEDHRAPIVTHMVWYKAGAADEEIGKSGVAHLLEHMLFKKTKTAKSGEFSKKVESLGGSDNAFTSQDYTGYYQRVSNEHLEMLMYYEADRMQNLVISENDFKTELDVVIEERNQRTDSNPGALFNEQNMAALYLNHPYGIPIVGWRHELDNLTKGDVLDFYKNYYVPNNAILIVAGDVQPSEIQLMAEKYYGEIKKSNSLIERIRPAEPPQIVQRRLIFEDERVAQPYLIRTYIADERNNGDQKTAAALTLLADLIGSDGIQSLLGKELQLNSKKAIYTSAYYDGLSYDKTNFTIIVVPSEGYSLADIEIELDKVIEDIMANGVDEDHIDRLKFQYKAYQTYSLDSAYSQARIFGVALTSGLEVEDVLEWSSDLQKVDSTEVLNVARELFKKEKSVTGWIRKSSEVEK